MRLLVPAVDVKFSTQLPSYVFYSGSPELLDFIIFN
jgi:hypothetical protein